MNNRWQFWVDVGGTFTDCLALDANSKEHQIKVLSSGIVKGTGQVRSANQIKAFECDFCGQDFWVGAGIKFYNQEKLVVGSSRISCQNNREEWFELDDSVLEQPGQQLNFEIIPNVPSPILAIRILTRTPLSQALAPCDVYLGTTRGTNALLTRSGARTALITSLGLRDFLLIGDQTRPDLFKLHVEKPAALFSTSIEISERTLFDGTVELKPDPEVVRKQLAQLKTDGIQSVAVCLMHSYRFPKHEQIVGEIARETGFEDVRLSSDVSPLIEILPRGETTVLDAYLNPVIGNYLNQIQAELGAGNQLRLMTSAGSLTTRSLFSGKDSVLSGPAGGVVGAARIAQQMGFEKMLGFDMGGTSTDVARFDGEFQLDYETRKADVNIRTPVMSIETVAAGGGSICHFDGTRLIVGPQSAGADPGPACYGAGGPLTVTDVNLFLGRIDKQLFPFTLDETAVNDRLDKIANDLMIAGVKKTKAEIANGFLQIANHSMSMAIQSVSSARGFDPRGYPLVAFGGAAGQHCCQVADYLGITRVLVHPQGSILSALGIQLSEQSSFEACSILEELSPATLARIDHESERLVGQLRDKLVKSGISTNELETGVSVDLRYVGTDSSINLPYDRAILEERFQNKHLELFGYTQNRAIEVVAVRIKLSVPGKRLKKSYADDHVSIIAGSARCQVVDFAGDEIQVPVIEWETLESGNRIEGPAMIASPLTSTVIDPGWSVTVFDQRQLLLQKEKVFNGTQLESNDYRVADPIELEIFNNIFQTVAANMGQMLRQTAVSVNVKQRLDYSCAVFSSQGELVVNAPHIPVHLGAMSETVKATIRLNPKIEPGDVFVTNDPYAGGSHLPDVTVLTPVFIESKIPDFWVASRAHHSEIGGIAPGSMPANARCLGEEGVIIQNFKLVSGGREKFKDLQDFLTHQDFPSRNPEENISDIAAQVAANQAGINQLQKLAESQSFEKVKAYMQHIQQAAEKKTRTMLKSLPDGRYEFDDLMDDGTKLCVRIVIENDQCEIDFAGSSPVHRGNLNANPAIVSSAIMYVLRCLIGEDIPLNSGIMAPVNIIIPRCFLNPEAAFPHELSPAVVGGNVETSQRVVDTLLGALGAAAASQGTMNNWLVGDENFGYYETVGGGSGASADGKGADAVHCHMSNTRLTDPEILETRYPMVLRDFRIRDGSGGVGEYSGGNGMIREVEFQKDMTLSLLTNRRATRPYGLQGGEPGLGGVNKLIRMDGNNEELEPQCERQVVKGDRLRLLTPGGGGLGRA